MRKFFAMLMVGAVALGVSLGAMAQEKKKDAPQKPRPNPEELFKKLDKNNDGKVTLDEFTAMAKEKEMKERMEKRFKMLDKGNKGYLTLDDMKNAPPPGKRPGGKREKQ